MLLELSVVEQRDDAVMKVLRDGLQVSEVAGRSGVSRQSLHTWLRRYKEGGRGGDVYVAGSTYAPPPTSRHHGRRPADQRGLL